MAPNSDLLLKQIFSIPIDSERYLIYAPLKGIAFVANPPLVNAIVEFCYQVDRFASGYPADRLQSTEAPATDLDFLHKLNFFQPESYPVDDYQNSGIRYDSVILFLTNQCNLRCSYCYASSGEYPPKNMPWEIAKAGVDCVMREVIKNQSPSMTLGFHGGGEPTINWDILTRSTDYARSLAEAHHVSLQVSGAFNGYWSKRVVRYIIENFTEASLSFDGMTSIQNFQRPARGNRESYVRVAETLRALDQSGFPYGIRMTVTNDSVARLHENICFISENFKPRKIQVEPVFVEGRAKRNRSAISDLSIFIEQFIKACRIAEDHNIVLFYSGARLEPLCERFCLAACRALVVTPDGDITTCFETYGREHPLSRHFIVGSYKGNGQFSIDEEKLHRHFNRTVKQISYCDKCFCKWHCAGDCAIKTLSEENGDGFQPTDRCVANQELTKFLVLRKIKENGGLIWVNESKASSN
jgi:uncharacterized protein